MSSSAAIVTAIFILVTTAIAMSVFIGARKRQAQEEEMQRAASVRGWRFESVSEGGYRIHRWSGSTEGLSWVAESLKYANDRRQRRPDISRWHGDFSPGINGAIVVMGIPAGKEPMPTATSGDADGFFAKLAQKALGFAFDKAIDLYFGKEIGKDVDAAALHRVDAKTPGFVVLAADKSEGTRIVQQGLERALVDASADHSSPFSAADRPSLLLRPHAISLARLGQFRDLNELDRFVHAGVSLRRAFTFGRSSVS
jgi:hypothetical protein